MTKKSAEEGTTPSSTIFFSETTKTVSAMATSTPKPVAKSGLPPPEKPQDIRTRSYIILAFWLVIVFLGLPMWWKTTSIYRADLPLDEMSSGKVIQSSPARQPWTAS